MNRLQPSWTVRPARVTPRRVSRRQELNTHNQRGNHDVTTQTENSIRFTLTSREGVRQINSGHPAKSVEVDYDPALIRSNRIRRGVEDIEYREMAS